MEKETNKLLDTSPKKERLVLVAVSERDDEEIQASLDELSLLVDTADGEEAGRLFQPGSDQNGKARTGQNQNAVPGNRPQKITGNRHYVSDASSFKKSEYGFVDMPQPFVRAIIDGHCRTVKQACTYSQTGMRMIRRQGRQSALPLHTKPLQVSDSA